MYCDKLKKNKCIQISEYGIDCSIAESTCERCQSRWDQVGKESAAAEIIFENFPLFFLQISEHSEESIPIEAYIKVFEKVKKHAKKDEFIDLFLTQLANNTNITEKRMQEIYDQLRKTS